ncbi:MAG: tyrosine-type recombinase/integrase [Alphaproteobacteria bacterium]
MAEGRITKRAVDALRCPPSRDRVFLWDGSLSGFGVAALASGKKVYVAQFRQHGRSRRMKLGEHGRLTPDEARSAAKKVLGAVEGGKDPIEERRAERGVRTFDEIASDYLRLHVAPKRKPRTHAEYARILKRYVSPAFGSRGITSVSRADAARLHAAMADSPGAANRCLALVGAVWNWAVREREVPRLPSPTIDIHRYPEKGRERYLTPDELRRLGQALRDAETKGVPWEVNETASTSKHIPKNKRSRIIDPYAVAAIRLLMLTGARLGEILTARWDYIDWDRGLMLLPDSKTGKKTIYLSDAALGVLHRITRMDRNPFIIPGLKKNAPRADLKRPWAAIVRVAGLLEKVEEPNTHSKGRRARATATMRPSLRIHDLRHTFAAMGVGSSLGLPVIGKLLGHSQPSTTHRYAHLDADPLHKAANLIGHQIAAALDSHD